MQENIKKLNKILFAELDSLTQPRTNYERNKALNETATTILKSFKIELDYEKFKANTSGIIKDDTK